MLYLKHARCRGRDFTSYRTYMSNAVLSIDTLFKVWRFFWDRWDQLVNYTFHVPIEPTLQIEFQKGAFSLFCNDNFFGWDRSWFYVTSAISTYCLFWKIIRTQWFFFSKLISMAWGTNIYRRRGFSFYCIAIFDFFKCFQHPNRRTKTVFTFWTPPGVSI